MDNIGDIAQGWLNLAKKELRLLKSHEDELAQKRLAICLQCNHLNKFKRCNLCGCFMPAKVTLKHKKCPIKKW